MPNPPAPRRAATSRLLAALYREATSIIEAELCRAITVDELARRLASSPRQLRRAFAEVGGTTFRAFVMDARMARAGELLASTDAPVSEVGRRVGYREPSQFAKAFKRARAATPSQFRARARPRR